MARPARAEVVTREEYLRREQAAESRHAFHDGEIFAMAGGSSLHAVISSNALAAISRALSASPCAAASPDLRIRIDAENLTYADATVIYPPVQQAPDDPHSITNPTVVVEVLSPSTAAWDRGGTKHGPGDTVKLDAAHLSVDELYAKVDLVGGPGRDTPAPAGPTR